MVNEIRVVASAVAAIGILCLAACGGGGGGDTSPSTPPVATATGSDQFLLFPNPQKQPDGSLQTNWNAYANAYYAAIDPANAKDTLAKWKAANGFGSKAGTEITVAFGDKRDLGYGRRMTGRKNVDGTIAFLVENYQVDPGGAYDYSPVSLEAAIHEDTRWRILINAIEFSPGPAGGVSFAKFFNFDAVTGQRENSVDLDGRGPKAMPGPCITCHGGRADALTPDASGKLAFSLLQNAASKTPGDVDGRFAPLEVSSFDFSTAPGFTQAEQQAALKTMNKLILCSYPLPATAPKGFAEDACRRDATPSEWQGTAADLIKQSYGGDGLPRDTYAEAPVPADWNDNDQSALLFQNVVAPACRACHILRGTAGQSDIDLTAFEKFKAYAIFPGDGYPKAEGSDDRIKAHVIDRGNMPLAKFVYDRYWSPANPGPQTLATFLKSQGFTVRDAAGAVLQPGRPIADPGPDRVAGPGAIALSADGSLFASAYHWTIVDRPVGAVASLTNPDTARPTLEAKVDGTYVLQLRVDNGPARSAPAQLTLVVSSAPSPATGAISFVDVRNVLKDAGCTSCHSPGGSSVEPPVYFAGPGGVDRTDDQAFRAEVRSRINFADIVSSPLLRKSSGRHHGGGAGSGFDVTALPGDPARVNYDLFLNWILSGAR
jgi:hypothetical protein